MKGLGFGTSLFVLLFITAWIVVYLQAPDAAPSQRVVTMNMPRSTVIPPSRVKDAASEPGENGGKKNGGNGDDSKSLKGNGRPYPRLRRYADLSGDELASISTNLPASRIRFTRPGEAESVPDDYRNLEQPGNRRGRNGRTSPTDVMGGLDGGLDGMNMVPGFGGGIGDPAGYGYGNGTGSSLSDGSGSGSGRGRGRGGNGNGNGSGDFGGGNGGGGLDGGDGIAALPSTKSAPQISAPAQPKFDVVPVRPHRNAVIAKADRSPIIDWIEKHKRSIPITLQKPEILHQRGGDASTWVEFDDETGQHYVLYLVGRDNHPPQLNIFLVTKNQGTLLQDEGARGEPEVYKFGTATGSASNPTVQLDQLPPGRPEARQFMAVFTAWWRHVQTTEKLK